MRLRFPLLLKKRGRRRTGSQRLARIGEILFQMMFILVGLIATWWIFSDVLLPEWRLMRSAESFEQTTGTITGLRVAQRPGLAEPEYCPELRIEFEPTEGQVVSVWTRHGVGRDSPSHREAENALSNYKIGDQRDCWFDPRHPQSPNRVLLSVRGSWIPYIVLIVPLSLIVAGIVGVTRALVRSRSSAERRSAMLQKGVDLQVLEVLPTRPTVSSALPSASTVNDSPGVRLTYRLPMDGTEGMRVLGMAIACVLWNTLAALFVYHLSASYLGVGGSIGLAALVVAPLAATGGWLTYSLWKDARSIGGAGITLVELSKHPLSPGSQCQGVLVQSGGLKVRGLNVSLICEEIATYRQGTDTRTAVEEVHRVALLNEGSVSVKASESLECEFELHIPEDAPISFLSPHNEVRWSIEVAVGSAKNPSLRRCYQLCVYPVSLPAEAFADHSSELKIRGEIV